MPESPSSPDPGQPTDAPAVPAPLATGAALVAVEGLVLLGLGVLEVAALNGDRLTMGLTTTVFFVAAGAGLLACAWGLRRLSRGFRGPAMMAQLICLGMAWSLRGGETTLVAVALAALGGATIVGLLHPDSTRALEASSRE